MTALEIPRRFRDLPLADVGEHRVPVAVDLPSRLLGLALLRPGRAGAGLLIPGCRAVHTFGMRFALEVRFLDAGLRTVATRPALPPWRFASEPGAAAVLELPFGVA